MSTIIAGALAEYESRFDRIDDDLAIVKTDLAVVKAELAMVKWTMGVVLAGTVALALKAFWPPV